ncbi:MAG: LamG-like jellyroll fold domain-containing protein [Candidatus Saccharimonadaceae bacterium]
MIHTRSQEGFTAVELLITLFVAAAFLVAGYQLFNVVINDGGDTRAESRASNVAYDYLRRYSNSATNPCSNQSPVSNQAISVTDLSDVKVTVAITCPQSDAPSLSQVESIINYGNPSVMVRYATYIDKSKGASSYVDVTNGLVARYLFNGNANDDIGGINGVVHGATPTSNLSGTPNTAYAFNAASSQYIEVPSTFGLTASNSTTSLWVYQATASASGQYIKYGSPTDLGFAIGIGTGTFNNSISGPSIVGLFEGVRWIDTTISLGTGWHFLSLVLNSAGTPLIYRDGALIGTYSGSITAIPAGNITRIGGHTNRFVTGSIDDVRVYNRALSTSEISQLYTIGPK